MKPMQDDARWQAALDGLEVHTPRPGYEQRFWARAEGVPALRPLWKWLPVGALLAGVLAGLGAGQYRAQAEKLSQAGPALHHSLPEGSLAGEFIFRQ